MTNINPSTDDEFNFSSVLASIKRRKKSFLIIAISIFFLTGVYSVKKKSVWEGTFQIVLKDNQPKSNLSSLLSARSPISLLRNQSSQNKLNTEILILQSPSVLKPIYDYVKSEYDLLGYDTSTLKFRNWKKNLIVKLEKKSNVQVTKHPLTTYPTFFAALLTIMLFIYIEPLKEITSLIVGIGK